MEIKKDLTLQREIGLSEEPKEQVASVRRRRAPLDDTYQPLTNIPSFLCSIYKEEGYYRLSLLPVQCTNVSVRLSPKKKVFLGYYWIKKLNLEMGRMVGPNNKDQSPGRIRIDPNFRFRRVRFFALVIILGVFLHHVQN